MAKWLSEVGKCDICKSEMGEFFYDFATVMGPWALGCEACFRKYGRGLGTGLGQKYNTETREKVDG